LAQAFWLNPFWIKPFASRPLSLFSIEDWLNYYTGPPISEVKRGVCWLP